MNVLVNAKEPRLPPHPGLSPGCEPGNKTLLPSSQRFLSLLHLRPAPAHSPPGPLCHLSLGFWTHGVTHSTDWPLIIAVLTGSSLLLPLVQPAP